MKNLFFGIIAFFLVTISSYSQSEKLKIDDLLTKVTDLGDKNGQIVTFDIRYLKSDDLYELSNVKLIEESDWIKSFADGFDPKAFDAQKQKVTIICALPDGTTASTSCGRRDGACVGQAVNTCLNAGGCATVCSSGRYVP